MRAIGGRRTVEGYGGSLCVMDGQHRNPTHGRQGKRPAVGAAHVVGTIEEFSSIPSTRCWRSLQIVQEFQCSERHRPESAADVAP